MSTKPISLRPGLIVSLRTSIKGGVEYARRDLETGEIITDGAERARWETTRTIADKIEHSRAVKVRGKARSLIQSATVRSDFGLLCQEAKEAQLDEACDEANTLIDAFNSSAVGTQVALYLLKGRILGNDESAVAAIGAEVRDLIEKMQLGLANADVKKIRDAASKAKKVGQMLDTETAAKVSAAVMEARSAARSIVKRIETDGEDAALVVQELSRKALNEARFAFLDLDTPSEAPASPKAAPKQLDLDVEAKTANGVQNARQVEV